MRVGVVWEKLGERGRGANGAMACWLWMTAVLQYEGGAGGRRTEPTEMRTWTGVRIRGRERPPLCSSTMESCGSEWHACCAPGMSSIRVEGCKVKKEKGGNLDATCAPQMLCVPQS